jgi:hypothetical protein
MFEAPVKAVPLMFAPGLNAPALVALVAVLAFPISEAVMAPALKFPEESL